MRWEWAGLGKAGALHLRRGVVFTVVSDRGRTWRLNHPHEAIIPIPPLEMNWFHENKEATYVHISTYLAYISSCFLFLCHGSYSAKEHPPIGL